MVLTVMFQGIPPMQSSMNKGVMTVKSCPFSTIKTSALFRQVQTSLRWLSEVKLIKVEKVVCFRPSRVLCPIHL